VYVTVIKIVSSYLNYVIANLKGPMPVPRTRSTWKWAMKMELVVVIVVLVF